MSSSSGQNMRQMYNIGSVSISNCLPQELLNEMNEVANHSEANLRWSEWNKNEADWIEMCAPQHERICRSVSAKNQDKRERDQMAKWQITAVGELFSIGFSLM